MKKKCNKNERKYRLPRVRIAKEYIPKDVSPLYAQPVSERQSLRKYLASIFFMLIILGATFRYLLKGVHPQDILIFLRSANPYYLGLALLQMVGFQIAAGLSFWLLVRFLFKQSIPWRFCHNMAHIGYYFNNITPSATGGQPMQVYYLYRCGLKISEASVLLVLISLFYNSSMILLGSIFLIRDYHFLSHSLGRLRYILAFSYLFNGGLMALYVFVIARPVRLKILAEKILNILQRFHLIRRQGSRIPEIIESFFQSYSRVSTYLKGQRSLFVLLTLSSCLQNIFYFNVPYFVIRALGAGKGFYFPTVSTMAVLTLTASGFPTPGAVGITETAFMQMYGRALPEPKVFSAMLLTRTIQLYAYLIFAVIVVIWAFLKAGQGRYRFSLSQSETTSEESGTNPPPTSPQ